MRTWSLAGCAALLAVGGLAAERPGGPRFVGLPGQGTALVDEQGQLHEDWGAVEVRVECEGSTASALSLGGHVGQWPWQCATEGRVGACEYEAQAWRAPTDPRPCDALRVSLRNPSTRTVRARLVAAHKTATEGLALSPSGLTAGARRLIALPADVEPTLPMNAWGLASSATALPGWAHPGEPCDPAFRNIRVGWHGEPITYRFRVEPRARRTVVLGLCESHWDVPNQRPLVLQVEGAPDVRVDPIGEWGRHVPGCVGFGAADVDGDGMLTVASVAPLEAPDRNSILNAVWVFSDGAPPDLEAVKRGERSAAAEYYVDCGGERDPSLYAVGDVSYEVELPAGSRRSLTFLVACRGASAPEGIQDEVSGDRLLAAAEGLWDEWRGGGCTLALPDRGVTDAWNASLAAIAMCRAQVSKYSLPTSPDACSYPLACDTARALDLAGHHREAEACLRIAWDQPLPQPLAQWAQREDGSWPCTPADAGTQARVIEVLADHYLLTRDRDWLSRAYPALSRGAGHLVSPVAEGAPPDHGTPAARALRKAAVAATALRKPEDAHRFGCAGADLEPARTPRESPRPGATPRCPQGFPLDQTAGLDLAAAAQYVVDLRSVLVDDSGDLRLLGGVPVEWLSGEGGVQVCGLPTDYGPVSFRARLTSPGVLKIALTPPPTACTVVVALPFTAQAVNAPPSAGASILSAGREIRFRPGPGPLVLTVRGG